MAETAEPVAPVATAEMGSLRETNRMAHPEVAQVPAEPVVLAERQQREQLAPVATAAPVAVLATAVSLLAAATVAQVVTVQMAALVEPAVLVRAQMAMEATAAPEVVVAPRKTRARQLLVPLVTAETAETQAAEALPAPQAQVQEQPALLAVVAPMEWDPTVETVALPSFRREREPVGKAVMVALVAHLESRATVAPAAT